MAIDLQSAIGAQECVPPPDLRDVMRSFATGVCIATTYAERIDGRGHGAVTINSLTSVSLRPAARVAVTGAGSPVLGGPAGDAGLGGLDSRRRPEDVARRFAKDRATRAAAIGELRASPGRHTGALVLDASSWLECALWDSFDIGDHTMVVGEVVAAQATARQASLIFLHGSYHVPGTPGAWRRIDESSTTAKER